MNSKAAKIWSLQYRLVLSVINEMGAALETFGLDPKAFFVLQEIEQLAFPAAVADALCMPKPTVTTYIKRLEAEALVRREIDAEDLRRYRLTLTAKGKKVLEKCQGILTDSFGEKLGRLKDTEVQEYQRLLTRLEEG